MPYINQSPNQLGTFPTSGTAANWSLYSAISDIDVDCHKLIDVKAIEFCGTSNSLKNDGTDTAIKTTNGTVTGYLIDSAVNPPALSISGMTLTLSANDPQQANKAIASVTLNEQVIAKTQTSGTYDIVLADLGRTLVFSPTAADINVNLPTTQTGLALGSYVSIAHDQYNPSTTTKVVVYDPLGNDPINVYRGDTSVFVYLRNAAGAYFWSPESAIVVNAGSIVGLGSMAQQNANSINVTGGSIDGTTIGANAPAAATITTLAAVTGTFGTFGAGTATISAGSINNTKIGNTTPESGDFTSLTASGVTNSATFGSAITPMLYHNVYATNVSMNSYNPLVAMNFIGVGGVNVNAPDEDINLNAGDINLTQTQGTSFMNLTAAGGIVVAAGGGVDITGGGTVQINSAGNVSIGSGNVLGADTEIEKVGFSDSDIYKVAGAADLSIDNVATIKNSGGNMMAEASGTLTLRGATVSIPATNNANISAGGTLGLGAAGNVTIQSDTNVVVEGFAFNQNAINTTGGASLQASGAMSLTGASMALATTAGDINVAPSGGDLVLNCPNTSYDVRIQTNSTDRINIDSAANGNLTITNNGNGFTQINSAASAGGATNPVLKIQHSANNTGSCYTEIYRNKSVAQNETFAEVGFNANDSTATKRLFGKIGCRATNVGTGNQDGALVFTTLVDGANFEVFSMNGADNENNTFRPLDMNGNALRSSDNTKALEITGTNNQTAGVGAVRITGTNVNANGLITINENSAGQVSISSSGFGGISLNANGSTGVGNIFINQSGSLNQTSFGMGNSKTINKNTAPFYILSVNPAAPSFDKYGIVSAHPHRFRAIGYSISDQSNNWNGFSGNYFGRATLSAGSASVANTTIGANDLVILTPIGAGSGSIYVASQTAGTGFTIGSTDATDTRQVNYMVVIATT